MAAVIAPIRSLSAASVTMWTNSRPGSYRMAWRRTFAAMTCPRVSGVMPLSPANRLVAAFSRMYAAVCSRPGTIAGWNTPRNVQGSMSFVRSCWWAIAPPALAIRSL